jgi:hypothetical protein
MKKIIVFMLFFMFGSGAAGLPAVESAQAASEGGDFEVDLSSVWASPAGSGFNKTFGVNFGSGLMLNQSRTLQGRIDVSSLRWDRTSFGNELFYERLAIVLGGRYYIPTYSQYSKFFSQIGVEASFDEKESMNTGFIKTSKTETNIGVTPGVGWQIGVGPDLRFVIAARYHLITDNYLDLMLGLAVSF